MEKQQFIEKIAAYVRKYAYLYGITVHSPIIAQAILESGWGESRLAAQYHNYFGLKCGTKWKGSSVNMATQEEYTPGTMTDIKDDFRAYASMEEGVKGYFEFIQLERYHNLRGITSPRAYLETIKADGYATSSTYVEANMKIVDQYNLTKYDQEEMEEKTMYSRQKVVDLAESWVGKNEADGSYKTIIDIYNQLKGSQLPRGTKMEYGWAWCACTWSAIAVKLGYLAIMPVEISCYYIIEAAKKMGCWVENDGHIPKPGDAVLYDWQDNGIGDNVGAPDHIGTVTYVNKAAGYMVVTEGNYSNSVKKRTLSINGRYIRGFICPKYDDEAVIAPALNPGKTLNEIAHEVIAGQWGNGEKRVEALKNKGYDPAAVQAEVNKILNGSAGTSAKPSAAAKEEKKVVSTCAARYKDEDLKGTYETTADLYCRNDAGANKKALCVIPKGTAVKCYGYYNTADGVKWLYIVAKVGDVEYTGYSSSKYLKKK